MNVTVNMTGSRCRRGADAQPPGEVHEREALITIVPSEVLELVMNGTTALTVNSASASRR